MMQYKPTMSKIFSIIWLVVLFIFAPVAYASEPWEIMKKVDERYRGNTWTMDSSVLLIDKNKKRSERKIRVKGKMYGKDKKTITYVLEPARIKGTSILSYDWYGNQRENESWLYLPDLGKVTRLTTSNRSNYFLGTDFTYGDLEGLEVDDFSYQFSRDEKTDPGKVVIIARPTNDDIIDKYGYKKIRYLIDTDKRVIDKAQYWLRDNGWIKYYRQFDFKNIDGVWLADREQMLITKHGQLMHTTVIARASVEINSPIDDSLFTTRNLERVGK